MLGRLVSTTSVSTVTRQASFPACQHALRVIAATTASGGSHRFSTWVPPTNRGKHATPQRRRQPHLINGRAIPLHVNDLKTTSTNDAASYSVGSSLQPPLSSSQATTSWTNASNNQNQQRRSYESDLIVVLDLDECLIHSRFLNDPQQAAVYAHQLKNFYNRNENENSQESVESFRIALQDDNALYSDDQQLVHVHCRPGVVDFLQKLTDTYETYIFTAAMDVYAKPVLDQLTRMVRGRTHAYNTVGTNLSSNDPIFAGKYYREHCTWNPMHQAYVKDLSKLTPGLDLSRTVLVDNNPNSFLTNANNGILVNSFYTSPHDLTLYEVWDVLQEIEQERRNCGEGQDVRDYLSKRFGLKQALERNCPKSLEESSVMAFADTESTDDTYKDDDREDDDDDELAAVVVSAAAASAVPQQQQAQAVACA